MGRKRRWRGSLELLLFCFLQGVVLGDGEVGCLFSKNVCRTKVETCYDDSAFGRCIPAFGQLEDEDVYRYDLGSEDLDLLRRQLERLVLDGYEWTHPYTQCIMQSLLYNVRYGLKNEAELCDRLMNVEELDSNEHNDDERSNQDSQPLAVVNFTPIRGHGYGDYANEKYYPPESSKKIINDNSDYRKNLPDDDYTYAYSSFKKKPPIHRNELPKLEDIQLQRDDDDNDYDNSVMDMPNYSINVDRNVDDVAKNFRQLAERLNVEYEKPFNRHRRQPLWNDDSVKNLKSLKIKDWQSDIDKDISMSDVYEMPKNRRYKNLGLDKNLWNFFVMNGSLPKRNYDDETRLEFLKNDDNDDDDEKESFVDENINNDDADELKIDDNDRDAILQVEESLNRLNNQRKNGLYTEGGLVQPIDLHDVIRQDPDDILFDDINELLWNRNLAAFQRPERVDVKKPGPLYSTNNYAFKSQSKSAPNVKGQNFHAVDKSEEQRLRSPQVKKTLSDVNYNGKMYESVDLDHIYIQFNNEFTRWSDGEKVVEEVGKLLSLKPDALSDIRVGRAEVTFKVSDDLPNDAMGVVLKIDGIREQLQKITGMEVTQAGLGDKVKLPPTFEAPKPMSPGLFGATVAAGGAAAAAAAVVTLIIARKHAKSRAKLAGLATPDPEASKDYQDLCRARMAAKQPSDKPESPRIIDLSRESESNRSSTSSWGEEAAALTNMDISTGHMVLSYMEDHLKNKDRLDQEWAGICAYEADPSSILIATEKSNMDRNRPGSSLPYDHSRVVLNDLSNADNSNYINASTITDHDPRNPAYIATQGPLPRTSADFWQLVWEQGSVVIVMLTRLTEEGRGMCHRYWPEEGSELYHIYEVHLVSEHIWCDDYLVRSFYLKNLRTGETRTVTQFHYLSWPENGTPQSTKSLLEFRRKVNKSYRGRSCPIVVHCSDGAGRTGTYCLIDMVLNRMAKGAKEIDIAAALEHIRDQRPGMVATKQQFEFVLVAVAEEVHAILKALPIQATTMMEKSQSTSVVVTPASATQSSSSGSDQ